MSGLCPRCAEERTFDLRVDIAEKVLERLATLDKTTIVIEKQPDGKMRVTSGSWEGEKIFLKDHVLEIRNVDGVSACSQNPAPACRSQAYDPWWSGRQR
jgi:hypothetical protein